MELNQQKEQFSRAHVQAIAAAAGFATYTPSVDGDSIDMGIAASGKKWRRRPRLELQLKCTGKELADVMRYRLKLKNYNDLRCECWVPRILVVVWVPSRREDWVSGCAGYWMSLFGWPATSSTKSVTVELPAQQPFSVGELCQLMHMIDRTGKI